MGTGVEFNGYQPGLPKTDRLREYFVDNPLGKHTVNVQFNMMEYDPLAYQLYLQQANKEFHFYRKGGEHEDKPTWLEDTFDVLYGVRTFYVCVTKTVGGKEIFLGGARTICSLHPNEEIDFMNYVTLPSELEQYPLFGVGRFVVNRQYVKETYDGDKIDVMYGEIVRAIYAGVWKEILNICKRMDIQPHVYAVMIDPIKQFLERSGIRPELVEEAALQTRQNPYANQKGIETVEYLQEEFPYYWKRDPKLWKLNPIMYVNGRVQELT